MTRKNSLVSKINSCERIRRQRIEVIEMNGYDDNSEISYIQRHWKKDRDDLKHTSQDSCYLSDFRGEYCKECNKCFN